MPELRRALYQLPTEAAASSAPLGDVSTDAYTLLRVPVPQQNLIHVHADGNEIGRVYRPALGLQADTVPTIAALADLPVPGAETRRWNEWSRNARIRHEAFTQPPQRVPAATGVDLGIVMQHASTVLPSDTLVANGAGNYSVWLHRF